MATRSTGTVTTLTLDLGGERRTLTVGTVVLVRKADKDCYGAVIRRISGVTIHLTFTPHGEPRKVPAGMIIATIGSKTSPATLDLPSIPRYQPPASVAPRRRKGQG